jgi:hypothetical protein
MTILSAINNMGSRCATRRIMGGRAWHCANSSSNATFRQPAASTASSCAARQNRTASCASSAPTSNGYVAADKTFCVYLAKDEDIIKKHAEISGFPATKITEIGKMIDPTTEHGG